MPPFLSPPVRSWLVRALAIATGGFACLLVYATHHPQPQELVGQNAPSDKTMHFAAYAVLASLAAATWLMGRRTAQRGVAVLAVALAAFGGLDEVTQPLFSRRAEPLDWLYDCVGIAIGLTVVSGLFAIVRRRSDGLQPVRDQ